MLGRVLLVTFLVVSACGGGKDSAAIDAPVGVDAAAATVVEVIPCTGESASVTSSNSDFSKYTPMATTITVGQIVKFTMASSHNVAPTGVSDPGLNVGFGATKCLRFTQAGTFNFKCTPHNFKGSITVN